MRRPQQQGNHHHHHHHHHQHSNQHHQNCSASPPSSPIEPRQRTSNIKDESRLARVKRVLTGSLLGRSSTNVESKRVFGVRLEHVDSYLDTGVPYVVYRLCVYIENHGFNNASVFRLSGGSPRLTERLRTAFERRGDADLEGAGCPSTAATLLRQYLKELPQPLVPSSIVVNLLHIHAHDYANDQAKWIERTHQLLLSLPPSHYRLFGYLANYLSKYEAKHGRSSGVCGVFAPVVLPHVPPATTLLRDILTEASSIFPDCGAKESGSYSTLINNDTTKTTVNDIKGQQQVDSTELTIDNNCALKPRKRKEHCESCCQERKLIRSNSEERHLDKNTSKTVESIRRVNSHEDFKSDKHHHVLSQLSQLKAEMGHGVRCGGLPLHERTNVSSISKPSPLPSPCDILLNAERPECDVEKVRSTERFSRSITPRGRRQNRRRRIHKSSFESDQTSSKENDDDFTSESLRDSSTESNNSTDETIGRSFLELLSSGPSRSPSPVRARSLDHEDSNNPLPTPWLFQHRQSGSPNDTINSIDDEKDADRVDAMLSPRNSLLIPRRFYAETDETPTLPNPSELGLKTLTKHINGLKKRIKKYEDEFEENFGYRPSNSDKMSNRDIKKLCTELNKLRKEYKLLKEDPIGALRANAKLTRAPSTNLIQQNHENSTSISNMNNNNNSNNNNNNGQEFKSRTMLMEDMVKEVERKLCEKRSKYGRPDNMEEMTYEQLVDEKTAVQKALLHIEDAFGRPVSKEDRATVRQLYDRYRSLKRLLIRAGSSKNKDSISELATILEHEAMDFTSSSLPGNFGDSDRRASEPDMSHRGILDCIDTLDQLPTDSDSQHSSSEGSRGGIIESLHSLPQEDLVAQQRIMGEEKKRLRRAIKELEVQFEARAGRRMQRQDRGPQVQAVYDSYKQTKAKLRLIDALLAKTA